ncbi:MAG: TonB-dependent receptor [bacterium]|nr:TonB-dependent receptor [bacterium]
MTPKTLRTRLVLASAVLAACASARAQQVGTLTGVVRDGDRDLPLAGVEVSIAGREDKATTTAQGNYSLPKLPPGTYSLIFQKDGYVRYIEPRAIVRAGQVRDYNVTMVGDFTVMEEYVVEDVLQLGGASEADLLSLRFESPAVMDSIGTDLMQKGGVSDAAGALRLVAGATVQDGKSAVIRGLPDRYVSSQINGVRVPTADEDKRAVELDQFPREVIESLQVRKTFTPDQQGDASGGAVNVILKGVPDDSFFFRASAQLKHNTNVTGRGDFLTYDGGGVRWDGSSGGDRAIQFDNLGGNWTGAVGATQDNAPTDFKMAYAVGGSFEVGSGVRAGGLVSVFYDRDSSYVEDGIDDSYWRGAPGEPLTPQVVGDEGDFTTSLFDIRQGSQSLQWGVLATGGIESENHTVNVVWLQTQSAEDTATIAEDTRGKQYFHPGYDPTNLFSPGFAESGEAPWLRLQTLEYTERATQTLQLAGRHRFEARRSFAPEFEWTLAKSKASSRKPDKRQFGSLWIPGITFMGQQVAEPRYSPFKPAVNFTLGALQRIYTNIAEDSEQAQFGVKLPFELWGGEKGYLKVGGFYDETEREFNQDTFSNFQDNEIFNGPWEVPWSVTFPYENHPITEAETDIDYVGKQRLAASYLMMDLPVAPFVNLIGGVRFENTTINIRNDAESEATWFPPNGGNQAPLEGTEGDASFQKDAVLPSIGLVARPVEGLTLRASYAETIARQTFKELSPILQQEFLGGPIFIGNPDLVQSDVKNYDLRIDYTPYQGGLFSASYFRKDITNPIEYVQRVAGAFDYTAPLNYPKGEIEGYELETRQALGHFWNALEGLEVGANATYIDSVVKISDEEIMNFSNPLVNVPQDSREMTNAPSHLYNFFLTYDIAATGTQLGVFYTVQGDTLVEGAGVSESRFFIPSVYLVENDRLNVTLSQRLSDTTRLRFGAGNLTNPDQRTVYRSDAIGPDITKTNRTLGIDFSFSITGEYRF